MNEPFNRTTPNAPITERDPKIPPTRRKRGRWLILLVVVCAAAFVVYRRAHQTPQRGRFAGLPPQSVRTAPAIAGDMPITLDALGAVTPLATVTVRTQVAGQLQRVGFKEGQFVKAGDFLAQIDPRPFQVALEQAQANLAKDTAALAQAKADLARYELLGRQNSISKQQVEDQQFLVRQTQAAMANDGAQVNSAKLNLSYARIVAPISGVVGLRQVDPGNYLQPSDTTGIVVVTQMQPISVVFSIPEDNLPEVLRRVHAGAKLSAAVYDRSNVNKIATGELSTTDNEIDPTTGTIKLRALFPNPDEALFPNQFVNVHLLVDTLTGVTLAPNAAIQRGAPGTFVYLVNANNTVNVRKVTIGPSDATDTVISSGLAVGQKIVIDGADRLSDGAKIVVRNGTPQVSGPRAARSPHAGRGARAK